MIQKMIKPKIIILLIMIFDVLLILLTEPIFKFLHQGFLRDYEESFIEPFFFGSIVFAFIIIVLLLVDKKSYITWLKYLVSWYVPLAVIFISQIDTYSSFILSIDRATATLYWMGGLFVLTVLFIVYNRLTQKRLK